MTKLKTIEKSTCFTPVLKAGAPDDRAFWGNEESPAPETVHLKNVVISSAARNLMVLSQFL